MTSREPWQPRRIGPAGRAALQLLACCPRMPTDVVGVLLGHGHPVTTAQLLGRLRRMGLVRYQQVTLGPLLGTRAVRLWTLTGAGRAFVATRGAAAPDGHARQMPYGEPERWRDPVRQRCIPLLVACYRLLAEVASGLERPLRVCAWEHPWIRTFAPTDNEHTRRVRMPAAATLHSGQFERMLPVRLLLLPDVGTTPLACHRSMLRALSDLRRTMLDGEEDEPVLVIGVGMSSRLVMARVQAWRSLMQDIAAGADDRPLRARVLALENRLTTSRKDDRRRPRRSAGMVDELFGLVARHPLLTASSSQYCSGRRAGGSPALRRS